MAASIQTPGGLKVLNQQPEISKYYNASGTPYTGTAQVLSELSSGVRHIGLTVNVAGVEYWFKSGVADGDLVKKTFDIADNSNSNTQQAGDDSTKLATTAYADRAAGVAVTTANEAKSTANSAATTANSAVTTANAAVVTANEAKSESASAVALANQAVNTATDAKNYAESIVDIASQSNATATAAKETAEAAVPAAEAAATEIMSQLTQYDLSFQLYLYNNFI